MRNIGFPHLRSLKVEYAGYVGCLGNIQHFEVKQKNDKAFL